MTAVADPRDDVDELVATLHDHLAATEEMALPEDANRWLGEAAAVAGDLADASPDDETITTRIETVLELLDEVDATGHDDADEHVAAARRAGERILQRK